MTSKIKMISAAFGLLAASPAFAQITTTQTNNANTLASALQGSGVTFTSATLTSDTQNGLFGNGLAGVGIANGVVLTTGSLGCVGPANTQAGCSGVGSNATLTLGFTATSTSLFFNYVFASEEYPEYVGSSFNDLFSLNLNGANYANTNLAQLPNGGGAVSINNVNAGSNAVFFRSNTDGTLPIEFDGLTTLLTASATNLVVGSAYTLTFSLSDVGDSNFDTAVFIQGSSVGVVTPPAGAVPEPATWAMMMLGVGLTGAALRRRRAVRTGQLAFV